MTKHQQEYSWAREEWDESMRRPENDGSGSSRFLGNITPISRTPNAAASADVTRYILDWIKGW
jgi:hypothetical protein